MATILIYGLPKEKKSTLDKLAQETEFTIRPVKDFEMGETVGYLVGLSDYERTDHPLTEQVEIQMMLFAGAGRESVYSFIDAMRESGLKIPHKANLTNITKDWKFRDLLAHMVEEKNQITAHLKNQQNSGEKK